MSKTATCGILSPKVFMQARIAARVPLIGVGAPIAHFLPDVAQAMQGLRQFMFQNVYTNPVAKGEETKAKELLERLFVYYLKHIDLLPGYYLQMLEDGEENDRVVCDYIAGMTDQYALAKYSEYFMPKSWQVY